MKEELGKDKEYILDSLQKEYKKNRNAGSENIKFCLQAVRGFCKTIEINNITRTENLFRFNGKYTVEILIGQMIERIDIFDIGKLYLKEGYWIFSFNNPNNSTVKFIKFVNEHK
jgi:hypothetical protein